MGKRTALRLNSIRRSTSSWLQFTASAAVLMSAPLRAPFGLRLRSQVCPLSARRAVEGREEKNEGTRKNKLITQRTGANTKDSHPGAPDQSTVTGWRGTLCPLRWQHAS